jgi:pyrrolysine biosynthesis protein PylD
VTRLTSADVQPLVGSLAPYDQDLLDITGHDLVDLALIAAGLPTDDATRSALGDLRLVVVPITSGLGLIGGFAQSVSAILDHLGCQSFVAQTTDVAGLAEASSQAPSAIFLSDDTDFMALDVVRGTSIHNTPATARGFVTGLACMASGLKRKKVLLMGCGPMGNAAAEDLLKNDAQIVLYDLAVTRSKRLGERLMKASKSQIEIAASFPEAAAGVDLIFDATNTADHIGADILTDRTRIAAPGMPCGVTAAARRRLGDRLLHDPLQIGVATMAAQVLATQILGDRDIRPR